MMHTIYVVSLGPGAPELLTLAADKQLHLSLIHI